MANPPPPPPPPPPPSTHPQIIIQKNVYLILFSNKQHV